MVFTRSPPAHRDRNDSYMCPGRFVSPHPRQKLLSPSAVLFWSLACAVCFRAKQNSCKNRAVILPYFFSSVL